MKTEKTLKKMLVDSDNALEKRVIEDLLDNDNPEGYIRDILQHGCRSGTVSMLIYYTDTKRFYIDFMEEIDEIKKEIEDSTGEPLEIEYPTYNYLAWLGYEETVRKVADNLWLDI